MEKLVANLSTKVQRKTLQGRNYIVAPVVMIKEGVFTGNQGSLFYDGEEIAKSVNAWNHRPITLGHPELRDGTKISGCTEEALDSSAVGIILNTSYDKRSKRLKAKAYFDEARLDTLPGGQRIKEALTKETPLEVSTGLFVDNEMAPGLHDGREFQAKAKNFRPDHLAIILNGVGACSLKDGAGLLVNKSETPAGVATFELNGVKYTQNFTLKDGLVTLIGDRTENVTEPITANAKVTMSKDKLIKALGDEHKDFVTNMSDAQVEAILALEKTVEKIVEKTVEVHVTNEAKTLDEVLALAPAGIKEQIQEAMVVNSDHRQKLVAAIAADAKNQFSADELNAMPTATLSKMAALVVNAGKAPASAPLFAGSGAAPATGGNKVIKGFLPPSSYEARK